MNYVISTDSPLIAAAVVTSIVTLFVGGVGSLVAILNAWRSRRTDRAVSYARLREDWVGQLQEIISKLYFLASSDIADGRASRGYQTGEQFIRLRMHLSDRPEHRSMVDSVQDELAEANRGGEARRLITKLADQITEVIRDERESIKTTLRTGKI